MKQKKPVLEIKTWDIDADSCREHVSVYIDGERVAIGSFGSEPEDNFRFRNYKWVDEALRKIGEKLGAEVIFTEAEYARGK